jgi:hypothetical protein
MVNISQLPINVVTHNKPKMLTGLAKGKRSGLESHLSSNAQRCAAGE